MPRDARPDRYVVDRIGTPDPKSSEYWVLDIVNDFDARVALARLGRCYEMRGKEQLAKECFEALHETFPAHQAVIEARNPKVKGKKKQAAS